MNLREQFEKETGTEPLDQFQGGVLEYVEWLEHRNKEQVEVLKNCQDALSELEIIYGWFSDDLNELIEEQLKKSE